MIGKDKIGRHKVVNGESHSSEGCPLHHTRFGGVSD